MAPRLEHANLNVRDVEAMLRFLRTAFPEFALRAEGTDSKGQHWVHVGTDDCYLALTEAAGDSERTWVPYGDEPGVNHLCFVVDDAEAVRERLAAAGYTDSTPENNHPHRKRVYFYDPEGNDWEFLQYLSEEVAERNDYELPDR